MKALLILRIKQVYRTLNSIGWLLILIALFAVSGLTFTMINSLQHTSPYLVLPALALLLGAIDLLRKDKLFLKRIFDGRGTYILYIFTEYLLLASIPILYQIFTGNWLLALICSMLVLLFSVGSVYIIPIRNLTHKTSLHFIPLQLFEVRFFVEQKKVFALVLTLLLFLGSVHVSLWILGLILLNAVLLESFMHLEPIEMLPIIHPFLAKKIGIHLLLVLSFVVPTGLISYVCNDVTVFLYLYGIIATCVSVVFILSYKYSAYDGLRPRIYSNTISGLFVGIQLIPGGLLITAVASIYYYIKASKNIQRRYA